MEWGVVVWLYVVFLLSFQSCLACRFVSPFRQASPSVVVVLWDDIKTLDPFEPPDIKSLSVIDNLHEGLVKFDQKGRICSRTCKELDIGCHRVQLCIFFKGESFFLRWQSYHSR